MLGLSFALLQCCENFTAFLSHIFKRNTPNCCTKFLAVLNTSFSKRDMFFDVRPRYLERLALCGLAFLPCRFICIFCK